MEDNTGSDVSSDEVRAALETAINSQTFARAERARALLTYLVESEQDGNGDRLKGFTIAQDVFDKDDDFDPAMDAVVRVQAGRLRDLLAGFYASEGRDEPVEIIVPKGTYVPVYHRRGGAPRPDGAAAHDAPPRIVDFGPRSKSFELDRRTDGELIGARPQAGRNGDRQSDALLSPFIVRNVKRFWLALAMILLLLTVILVLVWQR